MQSSSISSIDLCDLVINESLLASLPLYGEPFYIIPFFYVFKLACLFILKFFEDDLNRFLVSAFTEGLAELIIDV